MGLFSTNAIATKAKAMYGNRLDLSDYQELLHRHSVSEIAAYLKNETSYRDFLENINEHSIHREHLEFMIRQSYYMRFMKLLRYGNIKDSFSRYGIIQVEIKQILATLRSLKEHDHLTQMAQMPEMSSQYTSFDLSKLFSVTTYQQLLDLLKPTIYASVMQSLPIRNADDIDYPRCEIALKNFFYDYILKIIEREFKGKEKEQIHALFAAQMELDNLAKIYRLKKYYDAPANEIKAMITPNFHKIPKKTLMEWVDTLNANEFLDAIRHSSYRPYMENREFLYIEYHMNSIKYNLSKHHLQFSNKPDLVLLSYMQVLETEMQNLMEIIEGIRYRVDSDKISKLLIF